VLLSGQILPSRSNTLGTCGEKTEIRRGRASSLKHFFIRFANCQFRFGRLFRPRYREQWESAAVDAGHYERSNGIGHKR
jgi:hypothetical protein